MKQNKLIYQSGFQLEADINQAIKDGDQERVELLRGAIVDLPRFRARMERTGKRPFYSLDLSCGNLDMLSQVTLVGEDLRDVFAELLDFLGQGVVSHAVLRIGVHSLPNETSAATGSGRIDDE